MLRPPEPDPSMDVRSPSRPWGTTALVGAVVPGVGREGTGVRRVASTQHDHLDARPQHPAARSAGHDVRPGLRPRPGHGRPVDGSAQQHRHGARTLVTDISRATGRQRAAGASGTDVRRQRGAGASGTDVRRQRGAGASGPSAEKAQVPADGDRPRRRRTGDQRRGAPATRPARQPQEPAVTEPLLPSQGWSLIQPAHISDHRLCVGEGRERNHRTDRPLAVQRPCAAIVPDTYLAATGIGGVYEIQWHHPKEGVGVSWSTRR